MKFETNAVDLIGQDVNGLESQKLCMHLKIVLAFAWFPCEAAKAACMFLER